MSKREQEINFALQTVFEVLNTFNLSLGAQCRNGMVFPIIVDGNDGQHYAIKKEVFDNGK